MIVPNIIIYTDGSCNARTRVGGYGVYIVSEGKELPMRQGYTDTTTARMEMRAILVAIQAIDKEVVVQVIINSDSQFIVNAFKKGWIAKWRTWNYVGVANADLWKKIVNAIAQRPKMRLDIRWCRGHQDKNITTDDVAYGNSIADALADYKTQDNYIVDIKD